MSNPEAEKLEDPSAEAENLEDPNPEPQSPEKIDSKQNVLLIPIVPLVACTLLLVYVLVGGAIIDTATVNDYDNHWGYGNVVYFIFVSLLTIGYGDIYPIGQGIQLGSFLYLMFGFVLVATCVLAVMDFVSMLQDRFKRSRRHAQHMS